MKKIKHCQTFRTDEMSIQLQKELFQILQDYYTNTEYQEFCKDLQNKDAVLVLFDQEETPVGFTTWFVRDFQFAKQKGKFIYSGDTVIRKHASGSLALPIAWGKVMLDIADSLGTGEKLYWLLTTKGFRTYRYLSVFFKKFYPAVDSVSENLPETCEYLARSLFGSMYQKETGILLRSGKKQAIRFVAEDTAYISRSPDKHIRFFQKKNPRFFDGEELVCLAEFSQENLHPFILKALLK
ncbi:MAG: hypothetical protein AAF518_00195 [Spirochaetota bacterium]